MPTAISQPPRTGPRRREVDAALRAQLARFEAEKSHAAARTRAAVARELAKFKLLEVKYPPKLHRMTDASGKAWIHRDPGVLREWIAEKNRLMGTREYKSIQAAYEAGRRRGARYDPSWEWD